MSSRRKQSSRREPTRDDYYPTLWSKWEWNEEYSRDARYREVSKGKWEWEYAEPSSTEPQGHYGQEMEPTPWTPRGVDPHGSLDRIEEQGPHDEEPQADPSEHYRIASGVSGITQGMASTKIDSSYQEGYYDRDEKRSGKSSAYSESHHSRDRRTKGKKGETSQDYQSYTSEDYADSHAAGSAQDHSVDYGDSQLQTAPNQQFQFSASQAESAESYDPRYQAPQPTNAQGYSGYYTTPVTSVAPTYGSQSSGYVPPPQTQRRWVFTKDPRRKHDELDSRFTVHRSSEFEFGKVFKVLWSEPLGAGGTEITAPAKYGEKAFHKIRRFLVAQPKKGHSICIPILTYGQQGVLKKGVHSEDHAVIYCSKKAGPYLLELEKGLMANKPIRIDLKDQSQKLDPLSRLNYAKIYTVEHNVKVLFIGQVARNYEQEVIRAFNDAHPPLGPSQHKYRPDTPERVTSYAQQIEPDHPNAMPIPAGSVSTAWNASSTQQYGSSYSAATGTQQYGSSYPAATMYSPPASQPYGISYNSNPQMPPSGQQDPSSGRRYHDQDYEEDIYGPN